MGTGQPIRRCDGNNSYQITDVAGIEPHIVTPIAPSPQYSIPVTTELSTAFCTALPSTTPMAVARPGGAERRCGSRRRGLFAARHPRDCPLPRRTRLARGHADGRAGA